MKGQLNAIFKGGVTINVMPGMDVVPVAEEISKHNRLRLFSHEGSWLISKESQLVVPEVRRVRMEGTVYIAGPMRGLPEHNFPAFDAAAAALRDSGFFVFNPAEFDREMGLSKDIPDEDITNAMLRSMFRRDTTAVCNSTHIALLPGWENSRGVRPEGVLSQCLGSTFIDMATGRTVDGRAVCAVIGARMIANYQEWKKSLAAQGN